jgi:hypothetical protein
MENGGADPAWLGYLQVVALFVGAGGLFFAGMQLRDARKSFQATILN